MPYTSPRNNTRKESSRLGRQLEEKTNHTEVKLELAAARMVPDSNLKRVQMLELQVMTPYQRTWIRNTLRV